MSSKDAFLFKRSTLIVLNQEKRLSNRLFLERRDTNNLVNTIIRRKKTFKILPKDIYSPCIGKLFLILILLAQ